MVTEDGRSMTSSAKQLMICPTSARLILRTWENESRVFEKKADRLKRETREKKQNLKKKEVMARKVARKRKNPVKTEEASEVVFLLKEE